ncbi:MAG: hypothetical protein ACU843_07745 [Gammaproteobacteria bacterium]
MNELSVTPEPVVQTPAGQSPGQPLTLTFDLKFGFREVVNGAPVFHRTVVMRESITEDLFEAEKLADSERPITFNGVLIGLQIMKIGDYQGPLTLRQIGTLRKSDYALLRDKQMELERLGESG